VVHAAAASPAVLCAAASRLGADRRVLVASAGTSNLQDCARAHRASPGRRRIQAPIGNLLAFLVPRWRIVPAVSLEFISNDPAVVRAARPDTHAWCCCLLCEARYLGTAQGLQPAFCQLASLPARAAGYASAVLPSPQLS